MKRIHRTMMTAAVLFAGGIGAGVYVLVVDVKTPEERARIALEKSRVFKNEFGIDDVTSGELMARNATISFTRTDDGWRITSPIEWRADAEVIEAAINQMVGARIDPETRIDDPDDDELAGWGLQRPRLRLSLKTDKGDFAVLVGPRNKLREMYPITDGARRSAGLTTPELIHGLDQSLSGLREKKVFPVKKAEIQAVRRSGAKRFVLERTENDFRVATTDDWTDADEDRADILLSTLTNRVRIGRFLSDDYQGTPEQRKQWGFDTSPFTLEVVTAAKTIAIEVGRVQETGDEEGTAVAHVRGTKTVVEIPKLVDAELPDEKTDLIDRTILRFDRNAVARVELYRGTTKMVVERTADGSDWTVTAPQQGLAKVWVVDNVVRVFGRLKAERFADTDPTPAELREWLLDPPSQRVVFYSAENARLGDLRIGNYQTETEIMVMADGSGRVDLIPDSRVKLLPQQLSDLIDAERKR